MYLAQAGGALWELLWLGLEPAGVELGAQPWGGVEEAAGVGLHGKQQTELIHCLIWVWVGEGALSSRLPGARLVASVSSLVEVGCLLEERRPAWGGVPPLGRSWQEEAEVVVEEGGQCPQELLVGVVGEEVGEQWVLQW